MTELVRVCLADVIYMLSLSPFNYIAGMFVLFIVISILSSLTNLRR